MKALRLAWRYRVVTLTLVVAVTGGALWLFGDGDAVRWLFSGYAVLVAAWQAVLMVRSMVHGEFGLDVLAITAIVATVLTGEYLAALIVVLMLSGGEALEDYASQRAKRELDALLDRTPRRAHRVGPNGIDDIDVDDVQIGDLLLVRPAEVVPVDGALDADRGAFDQSSITGESIPVEFERGHTVLSGSVNGASAVQLRATARAADSQYQQIVALVAEASRSRSRTVRLADRYAVPFTVLSLAIAGVAWALSGQPVRFAEVLVLATPCPLLIAAPVAFIGGMSRAAKHGIVVKGGDVLERMAAARSVVFDKTGTLTIGHPRLTAIRPAAGMTERELLATVASAEQYSSHVLASSFIAAAVEQGIPLGVGTDAREVATNGVTARVDGRQVVIGKLAFVRDYAPEAAATAIGPGELAVYAAVDGRYAGAVLAADALRPNAAATIARLRALGAATILMLTGDAHATAVHVAAEVGIDDVGAECLPADKVARVAALHERPVIMVGDGVNDAPVLAAAEVGIAMGANGATAASESADAVILVDDIGRVADAVVIGRDTVRIALQSIWIGIAVSIALMAVAATGVIPAAIGALLQEAVDVVTIVAALRAMRSHGVDERTAP